MSGAEGEPTTPIEAIEQAILPALKRAPCLVSFSGDPLSAVLLAAAVHLARREGLELPVPATTRLARERHNQAIQERVIVHLGLTQWARFEFEDELDIVGPVAMKVLRTHGLMAPYDVHLHMPLIVEASCGSLLTSTGGAEAFGAREMPVLVPWLRPRVRLEVWARKTAELTTEPRDARHRAEWVSRLRSVRSAIDSLARVAAPLRVQTSHPFFDARFLSAQPSRSSLRKLFGELLPASFLGWRPLGTAEQACWSRHSRAVAEAWDGEGVDPALVDLDALLSEWSKQRPDPRSFLLLQSVALAREGRSMARQLAEAVGGLA
jgi:hypothetical protein